MNADYAFKISVSRFSKRIMILDAVHVRSLLNQRRRTLRADAIIKIKLIASSCLIRWIRSSRPTRKPDSDGSCTISTPPRHGALYPRPSYLYALILRFPWSAPPRAARPARALGPSCFSPMGKVEKLWSLFFHNQADGTVQGSFSCIFAR